jgi:hypothetical protein
MFDKTVHERLNDLEERISVLEANGADQDVKADSDIEPTDHNAGYQVKDENSETVDS